jgi:hypothetical protein
MEALLTSDLSDMCNVPLSRMPFARDYVEQRLQKNRIAGLPMLKAIRKVIERLAIEDGDERRIDHYCSCLLELLTNHHVRLLLAQESSIWQAALDDTYESDLFAAAIFTNHMPLVEKLVDSELRSKSSSFRNPIDIAINEGRLDILKLLEAKRYLRRDDRWYLLETAARRGELEMVEYLLEPERTPFRPGHTLADRNIFMRSKNPMETPNVELFGVTFAEKQKWDPRPMLPRHWLNLIDNAASQGWAEMTKHLISLGVPVEPPLGLEWKQSPLHCACAKGYNNVVMVLLEHGAQVHGKDLEAATSHGHASTVTILLEHNVDLHCEGTEACLYVAAKKGLFEMVRMLLDAGMDVHQATPAPIIGAVESEHTGIFWLLVERGARLDDPEVVGEAVRTAESSGLDSMLLLLRSCVPGINRWDA